MKIAIIHYDLSMRTGAQRLVLGMGNAMKEIGMYQDIYEQIRTSHNIPVDWDEADYEAQEIPHALRMGFRQAIQNIMSNGRIAISTVEYWEQFGG